MSREMYANAAIAGIGQTEFSKNSGRSELQLAAEATEVDLGLGMASIELEVAP